MMQSLFQPLDIYCERAHAGLWEEPFNTITNIAFFVVAGVLLETYRRMNRRDIEVQILIFIILLIGIGSFAFHAFANVLTLYMDVIPIGMFVFYYLWVVLRRYLHFNLQQILLFMSGLALGVVLISMIPPPNFNGSLPYVPCLLAIVIIGALVQKRSTVADAEIFFKAAAWLTISLSLRILDMPVCDFLPIGTHFLWHVFNAMVLYTLVMAIIEKPRVTLH